MPMIFYPIKKLVAAGITDILIVTGTEPMGDFISLLGSGKDFGCALTYRVQDEAGGNQRSVGLFDRLDQVFAPADSDRVQHCCHGAIGGAP